uniref:Uncharacterized protein n=1 Tax=Setaria italica TaxID=4555 RepID=K4AP53_SETIT
MKNSQQRTSIKELERPKVSLARSYLSELISSSSLAPFSV